MGNAIEEFIDIYDGDCRKTGRVVPRKGVFLKEGEYMLYVLAIIQDAQGRFLITQRALTKKWAAGVWEVSGGGVLAGETSAQGIVREVREETGLDIAPALGAPVYSYANVDLARGDNYFVDIYHVTLDFNEDQVAIRPAEAIGFKLATWEEIEALHQEGKFLHFERIVQALAAEKAAAGR